MRAAQIHTFEFLEFRTIDRQNTGETPEIVNVVLEYFHNSSKYQHWCYKATMLDDSLHCESKSLW